MKFLMFLSLVLSFYAEAAKLECSTAEHNFILQSSRPEDVMITFQRETVAADGIVNSDEVDVVARFKSIGEMTLFAKIGKVIPENYAFIQGKRFSVICR
jgi:hypothetical protein